MKIALVSLKFSPGHIEHLCAFYKMFNEMGHDVTLFVDFKYKSFITGIKNIHFVKDKMEIFSKKPDLVFIYNAAIANMSLTRYGHKQGIKIVYLLHEPNQKVSDLILEGKNVIKMLGAEVINSITCFYSNKVLLASNQGMKEYEARMLKFNKIHDLFPLIFCDEYCQRKDFKREYFSFIGSFSSSHAGMEFLHFMKYALLQDKNIKFMIATRSSISSLLKEEIFVDAIRKGRIVIHEGRPMTENEINKYYRQSICVWNAYNRSTQSGVLPNALMQGTPVIVNSRGVAKEVISDGVEGCFITMPQKNEEIFEKFKYIQEHLEQMSDTARKLFLREYFYKTQKDLAEKVIIHGN